MKKLPKVTNEQLQVIEECSLRVSSSTWIPGYDTEDIRQEAVIIGIKGIPNYNGSIPLKKYLLNHMRHRLRSLRREKYTKPGCECGECLKCSNNTARMKINSASCIDDVEEFELAYEVENKVEQQELLEYLDINIPAEYRDDYLKLLARVPIVSSRKNKLKQIIKELLDGRT